MTLERIATAPRTVQDRSFPVFGSLLGAKANSSPESPSPWGRGAKLRNSVGRP